MLIARYQLSFLLSFECFYFYRFFSFCLSLPIYFSILLTAPPKLGLFRNNGIRCYSLYLFSLSLHFSPLLFSLSSFLFRSSYLNSLFLPRILMDFKNRKREQRDGCCKRFTKIGFSKLIERESRGKFRTS